MTIISRPSLFSSKVFGLCRKAALAAARVTLLLAATALAPAAWAQVAISSSGSPSYSHPIAVPPGIAGMSPNLSLVYSGGGVNGPVGHGWSVQGISAITRCPATKVVDGAPKGVLFAASDKLCLDGQRLIQTDESGSLTVAQNATGVAVFGQVNDAQGLGAGQYREFRTEKDSFARIRAYGAANFSNVNGPQYFKVWTKAGQVYEYGLPTWAPNTPTKAMIMAQGKNVVMAWAVARVSDVVGNYIDFKYETRDVGWGTGSTVGTNIGREWNIAEVQYTGNGAQLPANKVIFRYSDRMQDRAEAYQLGSKNISVRRLDAIDTYVNSPNPTVLGEAAGAVLVKRVMLTYVNGVVTQRARVASIKECVDTSGTKCQPPVRFNYSDGGGEGYTYNYNFAASPLTTVPLINTTGSMGLAQIDYDGDGKTDLIRWSDTPSQNILYRSNGDGTFTQVTAFNITDQNLFHSNSCYASLILDFNGDGLPDILRHSSDCSGAQPTYLYLNSGNGTFDRRSIVGVTLTKTTPFRRFSGGQMEWQSQGETFYVMDINGDGLPDILRSIHPRFDAYSSTNGCAYQACTWAYLGNGTGQFTETEVPTNMRFVSLYRIPKAASSFVQQENVRDVDGDGAQDLVLGAPSDPIWWDPTTAQVSWRATGAGNFEAYTGLIDSLDCRIPLDFNGDGRSECLWPSSTVANNRLTVSTGTELRSVVAFNLKSAGYELTGVDAGVDAFDINGDGRMDLIRWRDDPTKNAVYLSNGDGTFRPSGQFTLNTADHQLRKSDGTASYTLGDFLGNGTMQILRLRHNPTFGLGGLGTSNQLYVKSDPTPPDQLVSVVSPTGIKTTLTYATLTNAPSGRFLSDREASLTTTYPMVDLKIAMPVVITAESDTGIGVGKIRTEYAYRGLKAALDGRGMIGFRQTAQQSVAPNGDALTVWTNYLLVPPYAGVASRTETRKGSWNQPSAQLLSTTVNHYCDRTSATNPDSATETTPCSTTAKVTRPYLRKSIEQGWDLTGDELPTVTTQSTYNDFGDPTEINVTTKGSIAGAVWESTKATVNWFCAPDTASCPNRIANDWILGRLSRSTVTNTVPNLLSSLSAGPGYAVNAIATTGSPAPPSTPVLPLSLVLMQLLLGD